MLITLSVEGRALHLGKARGLAWINFPTYTQVCYLSPSPCVPVYQFFRFLFLSNFPQPISRVFIFQCLIQVGNPDGEDKPNKKFYDPRAWVRAAEESMIKRANQSFKNLNGVNVLGDSWPKA